MINPNAQALAPLPEPTGRFDPRAKLIVCLVSGWSYLATRLPDFCC